ncbi:AAA family ATPase [Sunxiuqinia sp. A32]|uniref:AAA family ATPase n=1 Tax=Sunxiuqinia sp. A32 TaxID=3461496 RepID=UPI0040464FD6
MLHKLGFKNYKAYDNGELDLKPITILLGANSSGKSSILQLILMMEQTLNNEKGYESALKLNGKYTSLGEIENIFKNRITKNPITLSFGLDPKRYFMHLHEIRRLKRNIESEIFDLYYKYRRFEQFSEKSVKEFRKSISRSDLEDATFDDFVKVISEIKRIKRKLSKIDFSESPLLEEDLAPNNLFNKRISASQKDLKNLLETEINEYYDSYLLVVAITSFNLRNVQVEYDINYSAKNKNLFVSRFSVQTEDKTLIEYEIQKNKGHNKHIINSDVLEAKLLNKYRIKFGKKVVFDSLSLVSKEEANIEIRRFRSTFIENEQFCSTLLRILNTFSIMLNRAFDSSRINYISPLRAFPKRYYFLDESNVSSSLDSIDGDNLTEVLKKEKDVILQVNKWFKEFGLTISIEDVKEVIHRLKVNQNGLNLDITDVGFGISQVLPIIVQGFLSKDNSLTIIEQPEIHLHPRMQAELADLFIDVVKSTKSREGKVLLIETHSESILKRLRRRIAEGKISHEEVAIYFVRGRQKKSTSSTIERIEISESGAFDWPLEFYSTDYDDTTEFLKYQ